jgi:hypothetical protein
MTGASDSFVAGFDRAVEEIDPEVVDRALKEIDPESALPPERLAACHQDVKVCICLIKTAVDYVPTKKGLVDPFSNFVTAAKNLRAAADRLPLRPFIGLVFGSRVGDIGEPIAFNAFLRHLDRIEKAAEAFVRGVVIRKSGKRPPDAWRKEMAAQTADGLLDAFGVAATASNDGPYFNLASILFEGATGRAHVSIDRQCRDWLKRKRTGALK